MCFISSMKFRMKVEFLEIFSIVLLVLFIIWVFILQSVWLMYLTNQVPVTTQWTYLCYRWVICYSQCSTSEPEKYSFTRIKITDLTGYFTPYKCLFSLIKQLSFLNTMSAFTRPLWFTTKATTQGLLHGRSFNTHIHRQVPGSLDVDFNFFHRLVTGWILMNRSNIKTPVFFPASHIFWEYSPIHNG